MLAGLRNISYAVALVAIPLVLVPTTQASAYECKGKYTEAEAEAGNRQKARKDAIKAWSQAVKNQYNHVSWTVWKVAKDPTVNCSPSWTCVARAIPCKYVVF